MPVRSVGPSFKEINSLALRLRSEYSKFETKVCGRPWEKEEIMQGLVVDIGELMEEVMKHSGIRLGKDRDRLIHELCDCLWSILALAAKYKVDLAKEFPRKMQDLSERIINKNKK